jgi:hypothetical protein
VGLSADNVGRRPRLESMIVGSCALLFSLAKPASVRLSASRIGPSALSESAHGSGRKASSWTWPSVQGQVSGNEAMGRSVSTAARCRALA